MSVNGETAKLEASWVADPRWAGVTRTYSAQDVDRLCGSVRIEHTLARLGAQRLWNLLTRQPYIHALGALTGNQAVEMVLAGLQAIYVSGWQVAADANLAGEMYPDQSLYPVNSVPALVGRINNALSRLDQIESLEGREVGIVSDPPLLVVDPPLERPEVAEDWVRIRHGELAGREGRWHAPAGRRRFAAGGSSQKRAT